ncbi:2-oxoglutarate dehydrogenase E1 component [Salisediminibacterium halotolerans]|uniref:2-oxoglutarate dehydrogenase E1 component n=1 Tax=Salisediminibacterium halotolerans TaxID=517425 RepID=A0A1H9WSD5_9BACI|nr:2-oxoglutarate dehydrogenase E1 component [Salisediminibacterium haloalkalitolerans]SES36836.1 2-oxoglutarate dehydrogenase E1 component [Salisediminibacterium haloalkalitolerans]
MAKKQLKLSKGWSQFHGPNLGYMLEQYELFAENRESVEPELQEFFDRWGHYEDGASQPQSASAPADETLLTSVESAMNALRLAESIRRNGHLLADITPFQMDQQQGDLFTLEKFRLSEDQLRRIPPKELSPYYHDGLKDGLEAINHLKRTYTQRLAFEFNQVHDIEERKWLFQQVESGAYMPEITESIQTDILERLNRAEGFEHFIHKTFKGQKRFSIEGLDAIVPMLDELVRESVEDGAENLFIGMAHRGRLNVLAHVLGKPYELIFSEFHDAPNKELVPSEGSVGINYGWTGDVKYHLGADREIKESHTDATITLANNPSHLEFVNPVVEGLTRASQDDRESLGYPEQSDEKAVPILIHGDAAFPGQGVVAETLNLSQLKGYRTGGSIHVIANNMIGFTTVSDDSRSTNYASDLAKGYEIPIIHVNADDPEACLGAMHLAYLYRKKFSKDIVIDVIGYRRYGHNEMDEPLATQPTMYQIVQNHPTVFQLYADKLLKKGIVTEERIETMRSELLAKLDRQFEKIKSRKRDYIDEKMAPPDPVQSRLEGIETSVELNKLKQLNKELLDFPNSFYIFPKLEKILNRRIDALDEHGSIDWGLAETLAFATILSDGIPIRLTGQDSERGTFSQRHLVLHDYETNKKYSPLHGIQSGKASFAIHNSPLSEAACLGFEYGYNVQAPETLTIWEAQYGDFANGAQVILDQFISSGRAKWGQKSGLVLLLPHGYEGQGPEHSSARLERFLTLAAENNWHVANLTKASQYFHLLRRQAKSLNTDEVRPLVVMAPKSLLRNEQVASSANELAEGTFEPVLTNAELGKEPEKVKRLVLSSGKIGVELDAEISEQPENKEWLQLVKIEELYPFPEKQLQSILEQYPNVSEIIWLQEEPQNMGPWNYIYPYLEGIAGERPLRFIGRRRRSSPAEGDPKVHKKDQARILREAINE